MNETLNSLFFGKRVEEVFEMFQKWLDAVLSIFTGVY